MKTHTATSAGGVIIDGGLVVLTARRSFKGAVQWGLPKGLVEPGESTADAALREAKEETGLELEIVQALPTIDHWYVQPASDDADAVRIHKFVHFFLMRKVGGDPSLHDAETEEVALFTPTDAVERASFQSEKRLIAQAVEAGGLQP